MADVLVVAIDSPWPVVNGSRARMAGIVESLLPAHTVTVAVAHGRRATDGGQPPSGVRLVDLPPVTRSRLSAAAGAGPRLGRGLLDPSALARVTQLAGLADVLLVTHSYLAAGLPPLPIPVVVDVPNIEVVRQRASASEGAVPTRAMHLLEAAKARRWEPRVMQRADLCLAVDEADAAVLRSWGASQVVVVPNVSRDEPVGPSPADGHVLAVGDWAYGPNRVALDRLVDRVWPLVNRMRPSARLVLVGRGVDRPLPPAVEARGLVPDLTDAYAGAAVIVSMVDTGAGTQLKVVDAVARGRVIVVTPYGARSLPAFAQGICPVATDDASAAEHLVTALRDVAERHQRERLLVARSLGWADATAPLTSWLARRV